MNSCGLDFRENFEIVEDAVAYFKENMFRNVFGFLCVEPGRCQRLG